MIGAITANIIGSVHEYGGTKLKDLPLFVRHGTFTDGSVLTVGSPRISCRKIFGRSRKISATVSV